MESFELDDEQRETGRLRAIIAGELAGRTILVSDDPPGPFSTDSLMWLFAFDDAYCDEGRYSHDPTSMAVLVAEMGRSPRPGTPRPPSPLARSLADLHRRLDVLASPVQTARRVHAMKGYFSYQVREAAFRSTGTTPTLDQYAVARIRNGSMELCAMTLDIAEGYEVPATEIDLPAVRALTEMTCSLVGWDNDIASYYKEHERGDDRINLVDVIANQDGVTPENALPSAIAFRDAALARYIELRDQTETFISSQTRQYIGGLSAWIRGNLDWSANTARYRRPDRTTVAVSDERDCHIREYPQPPGIAWWANDPITAPAA
ncbi:terpene synthase family protein [Lentzea roselyniae]|uniref:terpene synthase family protein n=1 Tax=Lentzea roselyniae TaxID=531940 RepID=UPI0031F908D8